MNEFQRFVKHVRNLKEKGIKEATFNVDFLDTVLADVSPSAETIRKAKQAVSVQIIGDGGKFSDDD